jgi:hypothetical protein
MIFCIVLAFMHVKEEPCLSEDASPDGGALGRNVSPVHKRQLSDLARG